MVNNLLLLPGTPAQPQLQLQPQQPRSSTVIARRLAYMDISDILGSLSGTAHGWLPHALARTNGGYTLSTTDVCVDRPTDNLISLSAKRRYSTTELSTMAEWARTRLCM